MYIINRRWIYIEDILEKFKNDIKDNKELLYAIANFVCCKKVEKVEFIECIYSYDIKNEKSITLILLVDEKKIAIQFTH